MCRAVDLGCGLCRPSSVGRRGSEKRGGKKKRDEIVVPTPGRFLATDQRRSLTERKKEKGEGGTLSRRFLVLWFAPLEKKRERKASPDSFEILEGGMFLRKRDRHHL